MVFRRRYYKRKRFYRPKKRNQYRRKTFSASTGRRVVVHRFKRGSSALKYEDILGGSPTVSKNYTFSLEDVVNYTDFTNMYDAFKLTHVQLKFWLKFSPDANTPATAIYPRMWWVEDPDIDGAYTLIENFREDARCKTAQLRPGRPIVINLKPRVLLEAYSGSFQPAQRAMWLRDTEYATPHGGLKVIFNDMSTTFQQVQVEAKFWISCKNPK